MVFFSKKLSIEHGSYVGYVAYCRSIKSEFTASSSILLLGIFYGSNIKFMASMNSLVWIIFLLVFYLGLSDITEYFLVWLLVWLWYGLQPYICPIGIALANMKPPTNEWKTHSEISISPLLS